MPLFTMPKRPILPVEKPSANKIIKEEQKIQIKQDSEALKEEYAVLGATDKKFYFILHLKNCPKLRNVQNTYTNPEQENNQVLLELYALKRLLENQFLTIDSIIVYCNLDLDMIKNYANIQNCGSMFRYKSREILNLLNEGQIKIEFRKPIGIFKEEIENENNLQ